jgi:hypothetical protein
MTISSTTRLASFVGSGMAATFPLNLKAFELTVLQVMMLNVATSAIATLALTTDYSVTLNADQDTSPGGSISLKTAVKRVKRPPVSGAWAFFWG